MKDLVMVTFPNPSLHSVPVLGQERLLSDLDQAIRRRIDGCSYRFSFKQVSWSVEEEKLVLKGRVPSFYLKQILQTLLSGIQNIRQIDNRVDVIRTSS
jgi:hypothetical protein